MSNCFRASSLKSKKLLLKRSRHTSPDKPKNTRSPHPVPTGKAGPTYFDESQERNQCPSNSDIVPIVLRISSEQPFEWTQGRPLSAIVELLEEQSRRDSTSTAGLSRLLSANTPRSLNLSREEYQAVLEYLRYADTHQSQLNIGMSGKGASPGLRPIEPPPRELDSILEIDKSLVFEHFTTDDAWLLGSNLRERLMPIPVPVVINISLANQNQTLFHTCTHSGVMPDNDNWVARKRKTVLRWGVSTWYMHCKFGGDEAAFADKYGLGPDAGSYAIHGGGVPIRVVGVEGVVAVVVVSGLKQHEDHGVIVEVIKELYY